MFRGADSIWHGRHVPLHTLYKWLGTGRGTVSRRTANKKLTELHWPSRKRSPKRLIVLVQPKKWWGTTERIFSALWVGGVPPLSYSYRRHCPSGTTDLFNAQRLCDIRFINLLAWSYLFWFITFLVSILRFHSLFFKLISIALNNWEALFIRRHSVKNAGLFTHAQNTLWVRKKRDTLLMSITSWNIDRFSKFFHC